MKLMQRGVLLCFFLALIVAGCSVENEKKEKEVNQKAGTILAFGDSLTEGYGVSEEQSYPALLQKRLQADSYRFTVINAGISGEYSSGAARRLEILLRTAVKPDIVILETGVNDGLQGFDPAQTEKNIDRMLQLLADEQIPVLLAAMKLVWFPKMEHSRRFNELYPRLAERYGAILMPFFLEGVALEPELNLDDTVHPNARGYAVIVDNIYPYVRETIEQFRKQ